LFIIIIIIEIFTDSSFLAINPPYIGPLLQENYENSKAIVKKNKIISSVIPKSTSFYIFTWKLNKNDYINNKNENLKDPDRSQYTNRYFNLKIHKDLCLNDLRLEIEKITKIFPQNQRLWIIVKNVLENQYLPSEYINPPNSEEELTIEKTPVSHIFRENFNGVFVEDVSFTSSFQLIDSSTSSAKNKEKIENSNTKNIKILFFYYYDHSQRIIELFFFFFFIFLYFLFFFYFYFYLFVCFTLFYFGIN
jgi:hypothetical protein